MISIVLQSKFQLLSHQNVDFHEIYIPARLLSINQEFFKAQRNFGQHLENRIGDNVSVFPRKSGIRNFSRCENTRQEARGSPRSFFCWGYDLPILKSEYFRSTWFLLENPPIEKSNRKNPSKNLNRRGADPSFQPQRFEILFNFRKNMGSKS